MALAVGKLGEKKDRESVGGAYYTGARTPWLVLSHWDHCGRYAPGSSGGTKITEVSYSTAVLQGIY